MFDYIDYEEKCLKCGALVNDFQSKDGPCDLIKLKPWQVNSFYSFCPNCKTWIEYTRKTFIQIEEPPNWKNEFNMKIEF